VVVGDTITIDLNSIDASGDLAIDASGTNAILNLGTGTTLGVNIGSSGVDVDVLGILKANSLPIPVILSQTTGIDLTNILTDTALFTVPSGQSAMITAVIIRPTIATAAGGDAQVSVGTDGSTTRDDIIATTTLTGLNLTTESFVISTANVVHVAAAGEIIRFEVDLADTGTALTVTVDLIGYLV
jgi:hypothetical protein